MSVENGRQICTLFWRAKNHVAFNQGVTRRGLEKID